MILTLAWMEWRRFMRTPLAWITLALILALLSWSFLGALESFNKLPAASRRLGLTHHLGLQLFGLASVLMLIITPILTLRAFSDPLRTGSYALFSSAPLTDIQILSGKFLGIFLYQLILVALPLGLSLSLWSGTPLDPGLLLSATLGLLLLSVGFTAIGLSFSALSDHPGVAAAGSYGVLLMLSLLDQHTERGSFLHWLAWPSHYLDLQMGLVRIHDLVYFLTLALFFLALAWQRLLRRRQG
ncbi:MAG: ABC transporter permease subunit [Candidatus Thiodiazotropha sp.]